MNTSHITENAASKIWSQIGFFMTRTRRLVEVSRGLKVRHRHRRNRRRRHRNNCCRESHQQSQQRRQQRRRRSDSCGSCDGFGDSVWNLCRLLCCQCFCFAICRDESSLDSPNSAVEESARESTDEYITQEPQA